MQVRDGHRISGSTFQNISKVSCTRWDEAQDEVAFHAYSAGCLGVPTRFNVVNAPVNSPSCFSVAEQGPAAVQSELERAKMIMGQIQPTSPANPLAHHLRQIRAMLVQMDPQLAREGKSVSVIVVTAGLPTDEHGRRGPAVLQDFVHSLRSLEGSHVAVVVRLCTDDEPVLDFYNSLDVQLSNTGLSYDVLDDFHGEALEIFLRNPWLNYALPLHRFRQYGFSVPVFDELDERPLTFGELYTLCSILFDSRPPQHQPLPDPVANWLLFVRSLHQVISQERMHFNPITRMLGPWIDLRQLHYVYGGRLPFPLDLNTPDTIHHQRQGYQTQSTSATGQAQWQQHQQQQQPPSFQQPSQPMPQQRQQPPPPQTTQAPPSGPDVSVSANKYATQGSQGESMTGIKRGIIAWATAAPTHQHLRPIDQLLGTVPETFPPAFAIDEHAYFKKWKPFALAALHGRDEAVLKRGE